MTDFDAPDLTELAVQKPERRRSSRRRRRGPRFVRRWRKRLSFIRWHYIPLALVAIAAVLAVSVLVVTTDASNRVSASWVSLNRVLESLGDASGTDLTLTDFDRLRASVNEMITSLNSADRQTAFLRNFADINPEFTTTLIVLDAAQELALAAHNILTGMQPTLFFLAGGSEDETVVAQVSSGERVVELLRLGRGRFISAHENLTAAQSYLNQVELDAVSFDLLLMIEQMRNLLTELGDINNIVLGAPDLLTVALGLENTQTYIVLAQNSDEIRPSGGYVSTWGWMQVRDARITNFDYSPTTRTSPYPPAEDLQSEVQLPSWWIQYRNPVYAAWDGSWYADFPSTAEMAAWYYDAGNNPYSPVNGVLAIDIVGFEYILQGLGEVYVEGYNELVTPQNFREVVYAIRAEESDLAHKRFVAAVYRQILADWQTVDRERGAELVGTVLRALQERHIMLYFTGSEELNNMVSTLGWSGAQTRPLNHDYLMVVDANQGNKSNRSIVRQLTYDIALQRDGTATGRLAVAYDYSAVVAANDPAVAPAHYNDIDYNNLLQVFVPPDTTLLDTDNLRSEPQTVTADGLTEFVVQTQVEYDSSERFLFSYETPVVVERIGDYWHYRLLLQKQPGMQGEAVNVQVTLPPGSGMRRASPAPVATYSLERQVIEFRVVLTTDQWIEIIYR